MQNAKCEIKEREKMMIAENVTVSAFLHQDDTVKMASVRAKDASALRMDSFCILYSVSFAQP
jgi:hypothetical protein